MLCVVNTMATQQIVEVVAASKDLNKVGAITASTATTPLALSLAVL
jgi:hypothetical protein